MIWKITEGWHNTVAPNTETNGWDKTLTIKFTSLHLVTSVIIAIHDDGIRSDYILKYLIVYLISTNL